jgi:predicted ATPase
MLTKLAISGYRTLRNLVIPLERVNLITGPNGSGKSNLYRALRLLADAAQGNVVRSLAAEGGLPSTLWAGPEIIGAAVKRGDQPVQGTVRKKSISLKLGFAGDDYGYLIDLGLPPQQPKDPSLFRLDPCIKREMIWAGELLRPSTLLMDRDQRVVRVRGDQDWEVIDKDVLPYDSAVSRLADPRNAPEILAVRDMVRGWRFYDHFRSDMGAPARQPQIGTRTPVLSNDGRDLAPAIQTIVESGEGDTLGAAVNDAFPGSRVWVESDASRFELKMQQHGLLRPLSTAELSDGTLRYLLWAAALLTPRPPSLMVLNEPETSLHPDLLPPLARLVKKASERSQVFVVSHAAPFIETLRQQEGCQWIQLSKEFGETKADVEFTRWEWPSR